MATDQEWNSAQALTVYHEVEDGDYRLTVTNRNTGDLEFSMTMAIPDAIDLAHAILTTCGASNDSGRTN